MEDSKTPPESDKTPKVSTAKPRKEIPLVSIPNDHEAMAEEMEELFDEDRVTHIHGGTEPEAE